MPNRTSQMIIHTFVNVFSQRPNKRKKENSDPTRPFTSSLYVRTVRESSYPSQIWKEYKGSRTRAERVRLIHHIGRDPTTDHYFLFILFFSLFLFINHMQMIGHMRKTTKSVIVRMDKKGTRPVTDRTRA